MAIREFKGKYKFLCNFDHPRPVTIFGLTFQNSEAGFQAMKTISLKARKAFCNLEPATAKALGRALSLRSDWDEVKDGIMKQIVEAKFRQNPDLVEHLLATGDEELIEGTWWNDRYWGIDLRTGIGENVLGRILMQVREKLRNVD